MKVILNNVQVKAVASWLPKNILEMVSLGAEYGDTEVANIMKATGVERARIADKDMCSSDMCQKAAEALMEKDGSIRMRLTDLCSLARRAIGFCLQRLLHFKTV